MFLGGTSGGGSTVPQSQQTSYNQLSELNKKVRHLHDILNKNICCLRDLTEAESNETQNLIQVEFNQSQEILSDILIALQNLDPGGGTVIGSSCATPMFTQLCELQQILDALESIRIQINGDDIQINMNLDELEDLTTTTNTLLQGLMAQMATPNVNHVVVDNFPIVPPQYEYNNVQQIMVTYGSTYSIGQNSVHSVSYKILEGIVDINIGGVTLEYVKGEADMEEATTLIASQYEFTPRVGGKVKIKTIY